MALQKEEQANAAAAREGIRPPAGKTRAAPCGSGRAGGHPPRIRRRNAGPPGGGIYKAGGAIRHRRARQPAQEDFCSRRESAAGVFTLPPRRPGMLRARPARYVSGYVCTVADGAAEVPDYATHACGSIMQGRGWADGRHAARGHKAAAQGRGRLPHPARRARQRTGCSRACTAKRRYAGALNAKQRGTGTLFFQPGRPSGALEACLGPLAHWACRRR